MPTDVITPPRSMLEVYESLPEGTPVQVVQNKLIMSPSPLTRHQSVLGKLYVSIENYINDKDLGIAFMAPYDVYLDEENIYQPDILFVAKDHLDKIKENGCYGAPDIVIEILSPSTASVDRKEKKEMYEKFGVKEYWIVDPADNIAEGFWWVDGEFETLGKGQEKMNLKLLELTLEL